MLLSGLNLSVFTAQLFLNWNSGEKNERISKKRVENYSSNTFPEY
jgi:hypothetical protein